jgi:glycosyltransferase involved in cell wall biosynthesis
MRVCLICPGREFGGGECESNALARVLARRHEVTLVHAGSPSEGHTGSGEGVRDVFAEPSQELVATVFAGEPHRRSAAAMGALERAYDSAPPEYVEAPDFRAAALVPLMARRSGHELLAATRFGVRLSGSAELRELHNGTFGALETKVTRGLEREQLRLADVVVWPGGDLLERYRRFYPLPLASEALIPPPLELSEPPAPPAPSDGPLRILVLGPLERRLGALDVADACLRLPCDEWRLTVAGEDTETAPGGQSMALTIEAMFDGDDRVELCDGSNRDPLDAESHDLVAVPARFAAWPAMAVEAAARGLPLLATPVGGLRDLATLGAGWLADGPGAAAVRRALVPLIEDPDRVVAVRESGMPFARLRELADPERVLDAYERLLAERPSNANKPASESSEEPHVTAVVPYFHLPEYVEEAVDSLLSQTHRSLDVIVVNDGSFEPADEVLDRLDDPRVRVVAQLNGGESAARNLGIHLASGKYVLMLDPDNAVEPEFVARAVALLEREPDLAYAGCWLRFVGPDGSPAEGAGGYAAVGSTIMAEDEDNWDGDTLAVLRRSLFTEEGFRYDGSGNLHADWALYRWLRQSGRYGAVIPARLARYRVLSRSLMRAFGADQQRRGWEEARGLRLLRSGGLGEEG